MRIAAIILLFPLLFTAGFFAYVGLANDPGCGSQNPGMCFGAGVLMMLVAPLALLTTPASIVLFILDLKKRKRARELGA